MFNFTFNYVLKLQHKRQSIQLALTISAQIFHLIFCCGQQAILCVDHRAQLAADRLYRTSQDSAVRKIDDELPTVNRMQGTRLSNLEKIDTLIVYS